MNKCKEQIEYWFAGKLFYKDCGKNADHKIVISKANGDTSEIYRCTRHKNDTVFALNKCNINHEVMTL